MQSYVMYVSVQSNPAQLKFSRTNKGHNNIHDSPNKANTRSFAPISLVWNVDPTSGFTLQVKKAECDMFLVATTAQHFLIIPIDRNSTRTRTEEQITCLAFYEEKILHIEKIDVFKGNDISAYIGPKPLNIAGWPICTGIVKGETNGFALATEKRR